MDGEIWSNDMVSEDYFMDNSKRRKSTRLKFVNDQFSIVEYAKTINRKNWSAYIENEISLPIINENNSSLPSSSSSDTPAADPTQPQLNINAQDTRVEQEEQLNKLLHTFYGFPISQTALPSNEGTLKRGCNQVNYDIAFLKAWVADDDESHINYWIDRINNSLKTTIMVHHAKKVLNCM
jgi:hypothetical protein